MKVESNQLAVVTRGWTLHTGCDPWTVSMPVSPPSGHAYSHLLIIWATWATSVAKKDFSKVISKPTLLIAHPRMGRLCVFCCFEHQHWPTIFL